MHRMLMMLRYAIYLWEPFISKPLRSLAVRPMVQTWPRN